jgi:hypothetical protein
MQRKHSRENFPNFSKIEKNLKDIKKKQKPQSTKKTVGKRIDSLSWSVRVALLTQGDPAILSQLSTYLHIRGWGTHKNKGDRGPEE